MSLARHPAIIVAAVGLAMTPGARELLAGTATISLPQAAMTSAGIYAADGRLVHTAWSGRAQPAGPVTVAWNGLDDDGRRVDASQAYVARLLAHHVRYVWEGVIGNTSAAMAGANIHRALDPIQDMAIDGTGNAFYVVGYNEQQSALHRFSVADPQHAIHLAHDDYRNVFRYVATDGVLAYFANIGKPSFVLALRVADGSEYRFPGGHPQPSGPAVNVSWQSVIDAGDADSPTAPPAPPSGLAVQRLGDSLFVAHAQANEIRVLDKRTGELRGRIEVAAPTGLAVAPDDSLWVLCQCRAGGLPAVVRYRPSAGKWRQELEITADLRNPVALAASPRDGLLVVADAGTEQLQGFDAHGAHLWSMGRAGGYGSNGPEVTVDKFWFSFGPSYIAFQPDGSFWVGDPANARNLHFSPQRVFIDQIMYLPKSYVATVDTADPTRVFSGFLEFKVDYSRPLPESWSLVRNWAVGLDQRYLGGMPGLRSVVALRNGRTYATLPRSDLKGSELAELTAAGVRPTNFPLDVGTRLYADGSLRSQVIAAGALSVYQRALIDFDAAGNPRWGDFQLLSRVGPLRDSDPYYHDVPVVVAANDVTYPDLDSKLVVSFNPGRSPGFHLGALRSKGDGWMWRASPAGTWSLDRDGDIAFGGGVYELDRGVQYPGSIAMASGSQVIYGYHGEAWNGGQANQWLHFFANGLFVGQFGRPVYPGRNKLEALPECAGNAFSPSLVTVNGQLYLWHNDESVHSGVHRWHIAGADRLELLEAPITP